MGEYSAELHSKLYCAEFNKLDYESWEGFRQAKAGMAEWLKIQLCSLKLYYWAELIKYIAKLFCRAKLYRNYITQIG